jgi:transcriptional regulator with XRE-family HTH domain
MAKGIKLSEIARITGKDIALLSKYETGVVKEIPTSFLPEVAKILEVRVSDFFEDA